MNLIIQFVVAVFATLAFAVLFSAPFSEWLYCGVNGAIGWIIYYVMTGMDYNKAFASAVATFVLTLVSRILAVRRKTPVTMYLLPGIFPLVPGAGIYYTAYYMFTGDNITGGLKGIETFEIAGAIVIGIIFGTALPQKFFSLFARNTKEAEKERKHLNQQNRNFPG